MSARPSNELLFRQYRETGDPEPLSEVFDRTAPRLMRFALHVEGDLQRAEEILQATFLTALEKADRYDGERPLVSWLLGILAVEAKRSKTSRARRPDPDRMPLTLEPEPSAHAEATELEAAVETVLPAFPRETAELLRLRLRGFTPAEIAAELGVSPGSVRTRLHRALGKLREKLPRGFELSVLAYDARGLDAVKAAVLAKASASAAWPVAMGSTLMKKKLGLLAGLVILVAGSAVVISRLAGDGVDAREDSASIEPLARPELAKPALRAELAANERIPEETDPIAAGSEPATAPSEPTEPTEEDLERWKQVYSPGVLAGLVLDGHEPWTGGGTAILRPKKRLPEDLSEPFEGRVTVPINSHGEFEFRVDQPATYHIAVDLGGSLQRRVSYVWNEGMRTNLMIVMLYRASVSGTVYDAQGKPRADIQVRLGEKAPTVVGMVYQAFTRTDERGHYEFDRLASGSYWLSFLPTGSLFDTDQNHSRVVTLEIGEQQVCDLGSPAGFASWTGFVRDPRTGDPVPGKKLSLHDPETDLRLSFSSGEDGSFSHPVPPGRYVVSYGGFDRYVRHGELKMTDETHREDVLLAPTIVHGQVTYRGSGEDPARAFASTQLRLEKAGDRWTSSNIRIEDDGTWCVCGVPPGDYELSTWPGKMCYAGDRLSVTVEEGAESVEANFDLCDPE